MQTYRTQKQTQSGFTLIELMIVVALIGILAAIVVPNYRAHVVKGKRAAAQAEMMAIANRQQQYLLANRTYADKATLNYSLSTDVSKDYTYTMTTGTSPLTFTVTFTAKDGQGSSTSNEVLTLDNENNKTPSDKW